MTDGKTGGWLSQVIREYLGETVIAARRGDAESR